MILNLYDILEQVLTESATPSDVSDAIANRYRVIINYSDQENHAPKWRIIEPYVFGKSKGGNDVFRAFQYDGDSWRSKTLGGSHKIPQWRLFRLDRVVNWKPTKEHFNAPPEEIQPSAIPYNQLGDKSMTDIYCQVQFDYDDISDNPYTKGSDLYNIRKRSDAKRISSPIKLTDLMGAKPGPINTTPSDDSIDMDMVKRNLELTKKEKQKRGFNINKPKNTVGQPQEKDGIDMDMLNRNLELTRKEKQRRGFDINKPSKNHKHGPILKPIADAQTKKDDDAQTKNNSGPITNY